MTTETESRRQAEVIGHWMAEADRFAQGLGIRLVSVAPGCCEVTMLVTEAMHNGVGTTHGGATFTLADFAFAIAANSHGRTAVALSTQMSYPAASHAGDTLTAVATEESLGGRTGLYRVEVRRDDGTLVGLFTGTVFRRRDAIGPAVDSGDGQVGG
ncbi:MAG: hydroxyphenylacetyl-CoA thioesterase PaaI [Gammaproteobacteria bacterium]|nr:MAG: hydroxyphenylacetyl-CoA thioesterase PaaI [Gammaproteobacteria bacterium]